MTPNKVIEIVDRLRPNTYDEEDKLRWINELDGQVQRLVFQEEKIKQYAYPDDMDTELLIPAPFDNVYVHYITAQIDYNNTEYDNYNNSVLMYETQFNEYKKDYIRKHRAKG